jgi:RNA polymerase sigma-70 factor, ECF subfamily
MPRLRTPRGLCSPLIVSLVPNSSDARQRSARNTPPTMNLRQVGLKDENLRSLLILGLAGDGPAYRLFLSKLSAHLRSYLRKRLPRLPEDVEDLVQELLLAIHNQRHTYDPEQPLIPWVDAIARYKHIDSFRRRSRRETLHDELDEEDELFVARDIAAVAEARYDLATILQHLPDRQRLPILYVKIEGASVAETAMQIGMSESAVKVGIHRGLKALAIRLRGSE